MSARTWRQRVAAGPKNPALWGALIMVAFALAVGRFGREAGTSLLMDLSGGETGRASFLGTVAVVVPGFALLVTGIVAAVSETNGSARGLRARNRLIWVTLLLFLPFFATPFVFGGTSPGAFGEAGTAEVVGAYHQGLVPGVVTLFVFLFLALLVRLVLQPEQTVAAMRAERRRRLGV